MLNTGVYVSYIYFKIYFIFIFLAKTVIKLFPCLLHNLAEDIFCYKTVRL